MNGNIRVHTEQRFDMNRAASGFSRRQLIKYFCLMTGGGLLGLLNISKGFAAENARFQIHRTPRIALIVDDIGYNRSLAWKFIELNEILTFSILPQVSYSRELAFELNDRGYEVMLHQPMEPYNNCCDPGPGALFVGDNAQRIEKTLQTNIRSIPFAKGVNNHMGSKFTASPNEIGDALKVIRSSGMFFVDSFTSSRSLAHATARRYHIPTAHRNVFLDNVRRESAIISQLVNLQKHAMLYGRAIGIGHPFPETASAIGRFAKRLKQSNVSLVPVSEIL
jgi:polysaccharide deacetylase 2 family uncharacterized protein YibQ